MKRDRGRYRREGTNRPIVERGAGRRGGGGVDRVT